MMMSNNGDIGYVRKIIRIGDDTTVHVDICDGRMKEYDSSELDMLDLGYASTIHKSQGAGVPVRHHQSAMRPFHHAGRGLLSIRQLHEEKSV